MPKKIKYIVNWIVNWEIAYQQQNEWLMWLFDNEVNQYDSY
jgi:hypothetical protein